jgi:hypothetical protein
MSAERVPDLTFITQDHPEAGGRTPVVGDIRYELTFPLDDGRLLAVQCGVIGIQSLLRALLHYIDMGDTAC